LEEMTMKNHKNGNVLAKITLYDRDSGARIANCPLQGFDEAIATCQIMIRQKMGADRAAYQRWAKSMKMYTHPATPVETDTGTEEDDSL